MSFGLLRSWLNRPAPANRRPRKSARPPVAIEQLEERQLLATALTAPLLFDFGTDTSPVADGAVGVPLVKYSSARGYGWKSLPGLTAVDRLTSDPLTCDFHRGRNGTFVVDLPNGSYQVTAILGDPFSLLDRVNLTVEGQMVAARLFANVGGTVRATFQADVTDGRLDLQIADKGGSNPYFSLAALNISPNLTANAGGDQSAIEGQAVSFSGSVSGVSTTGLSYLWNFGDGSTATGTLTPSHTYRDNGTYKVTLYVSDATGATAHDTVMVTVDNAAPVAELGGPYEVAVSTPLTIDPLISDPGAQDELVGFTFAWNFGDGSTASGDPGTHAWATPGTYTVQLRVTDKDGAATTASTTVTVKGAAAPVVSAGPDRTAAEGQAVSFSGSVSGVSTTGLSYLWNFGDGATATGTLTPSHTYRDNGIYTVTLNVTDSQGVTTRDTAVVTVTNVAPTASAGGPYRGTAGTAISFVGNARDASPVDQGSLTYVWNFGDSTSGSGATPSHVYSAAGTYTVSLTVLDKDGGRATVQTTATIDPAAPPTTPVVSAGPDRTAAEGQAVSFSGSVSGVSTTGLSYLWNFGDGATATGTLTPSHTYRDNGIYTVTLNVTDSQGVTTRDTAVVTVTNVAPTVSAGGPYSGMAGSPVSFSAFVSDAGPADTSAGFSYVWNFGDGTSGSGAMPSHAYHMAGTYTVRLTVSDKDGGTASATTTVNVMAAPEPQPPGSVIVTPHGTIPNFGFTPTIVAVNSGAWSNPATWSLGRLPAAGDIVAIGADQTVTYDLVSDTPLHTISIQAGGHLTFRTDINTRVVVTNLQVLEGGRLTIGTPTNPVAANVRAEIIFADTPIDLVHDPDKYGTGLIALGQVMVHGAVKTSGPVRLAAEPQAGDTTLRLARPVQGWQAGDRLVLPGTRGLAGETEILTLAAVSADGLTLTLATPLQYSHPGARGDRKNNPVLERLAARHPSDWLATPVVPGDTRTNVLDFLPHVGNLTRNVIFRSQNPSGTRGHIMVTHTGEGDFRWAEFRDLGRTTFREPADPTGMMGRQGRYAVHFHHVMDQMDCPEPCNRLEGSSLWSELPNHEIAWPVTVHDTRGVLIRENVAYNWMGAAFVTEDDGAQRNIIERNFSVRVGGSGGRTDWGNAANGFFFWGNDNIIRDNVAADIGWAAFEMYSASPFAEFARNEAYNTPDALRYWNIGGGDNPSPDLNAPQRVMKDFTAWSVGRDAVVNYPSIHLTFDGFVLRGLPGSAMGYNWGDYGTRNYLVQNNDVQGFNFGMHMPLKFNPTAVYEPGTFEIKDSYLRNRVNLWVINPAGPGAGGAVSVHPGTMIIRNVRYGDPYGNPSGNIYFDFWLPAQVHLLQRMQIFVYDYNGAVGQNFRAYWYEQASDFIVPYGDPNQGSNFVGAPEAGLTNAQAAARWEWRLSLEPLQFQYRLVGTQGPSSNQATPWQPVVIAGEMAPANATDGRPIGVHGLIAPL